MRIIEITEDVVLLKTSEGYKELNVQEYMKPLRSKEISRRSKAPGTKLSRKLSLYAQAVRTGKWASGAPFTREQAVAGFRAMGIINPNSLTPKGRVALQFLQKEIGNE